MSRCFIWFPFGLFFRRTQVISEFGGFYKKQGGLWRVSDWWRHLRKHLGRNESKTTLCINGEVQASPPGSHWTRLSYRKQLGTFMPSSRVKNSYFLQSLSSFSECHILKTFLQLSVKVNNLGMSCRKIRYIPLSVCPIIQIIVN